VALVERTGTIELVLSNRVGYIVAVQIDGAWRVVYLIAGIDCVRVGCGGGRSHFGGTGCVPRVQNRVASLTAAEVKRRQRAENQNRNSGSQSNTRQSPHSLPSSNGSCNQSATDAAADMI
jgi:hypothetical protein